MNKILSDDFFVKSLIILLPIVTAILLSIAYSFGGEIPSNKLTQEEIVKATIYSPNETVTIFNNKEIKELFCAFYIPCTRPKFTYFSPEKKIIFYSINQSDTFYFDNSSYLRHNGKLYEGHKSYKWISKRYLK